MTDHDVIELTVDIKEGRGFRLAGSNLVFEDARISSRVPTVGCLDDQ
jgi:hypothetical protein